MAGRKKNPAQTEATRVAFLEKSYELFTERTIEAVSMIEIAKECGYGTMTLYRYYKSKPELVVAVAARKWQEFICRNHERRPAEGFAGMTAAEIFDFYLDSFLLLYRDHRELLRFNLFFNIYIQAEGVEPEVMEPYREVIGTLEEIFHILYERAGEDHTIRTDEGEEKMFSLTLHFMLALVTRYAVGLLYTTEDPDAIEELNTFKEMIMTRYRVNDAPDDEH